MTETSEARVKIIGTNESGAAGLSPDLVKTVKAASILAGGERLLAMFPGFSGDKILIRKNIMQLPGQILSALQEKKGYAVVLASGDPLFFGIGALLARKLPRGNVEIFPALSSLQLAFARAGLGWNDAANLSLHGRPIAGLAQKINGRSKIALLTDTQNHPGAIAAYLNRFEIDEYRLHVAEDLGGPDEKFCVYGPQESQSLNDLAAKAASEFHELNLVILEKVRDPADRPAWTMGIDDEEFCTPQFNRGLITKKEIRVQVLAALELFGPASFAERTFWDIGACTGSVSVEAARLDPELQIFALEKNPERLDTCRRNMVKFRTDFTLVHAAAPSGLENLPAPSAVFIGGSGGNLGEILDFCCEKLLPGGVVVSAAATFETLETASRTMRALGCETEITQHWISRSRPVGPLHRLEAQNPVFLIRGKKPGAPRQEENQNSGRGVLIPEHSNQ